MVVQVGRHSPFAVSGVEFTLDFTISDERALAATLTEAPPSARYYVEVRMGQILLFNETYSSSGQLSAIVPCPRQRATGVLTVSLLNEHSQYFEDKIAISFNEDFREVIKWVALMPYLLAVVVVITSTMQTRSALPM